MQGKRRLDVFAGTLNADGTKKQEFESEMISVRGGRGVQGAMRFTTRKVSPYVVYSCFASPPRQTGLGRWAPPTQ